MTLTPGTRLGRYEILDRLGRGGMGEVFRARDGRLGRTVAIKTLPPRFERDPIARGRFEREARAVAALSHPNILAIHDVGDEAGIVFVVMELLEGVSLRARLFEGPMPEDAVLDCARQLARGLAAAHARGIVHRDLKPDNIFLCPDRLVKILDFGLATVSPSEVSGDAETRSDISASPDAGAPETRMAFGTMPGSVLGTPEYMSPEQVRGRPADERSDIFSFGAVLHEMLSGESPFAGESAADSMSAVLTRQPAAPTNIQSPTAAALAQLALTCLAKAPDQRVQSARKILDALDRIEGGSPAMATSAGSSATYTSIAVLPFADMSPARELDYLCDGLAEEISTGLMKVRGLRVAARSSTSGFAPRDHDVRQIGSTLGVDTVLEGSVRSAGAKLRVATQLVGTSDGLQLWAERFEGDLDDVFGIEDRISRAVIRALHLQRTRTSAESLLVPRATDPEAHTLYLKGRHQWNKRTEDGLRKSIGLFQSAIEHDPLFGPAHGALAEAFLTLGLYGVLPATDVMPKARAAAEKALAIEGPSAGPMASLASIKSMYSWAWTEAEDDFELALDLDPDYPTGHQWYAMHLLAPAGRLEEAHEHLGRAAALDPLSLPIGASRGLCWYYGRDFDRAIMHFRHMLDLDGGFAFARYGLGLSLVEVGDHVAAVKQLEQAVTASGNSPEMLAALGYALARAGSGDRARSIGGELSTMATRRYVSPLATALVDAGLGEVDRAIRTIEQALDTKPPELIWLGIRPVFDELRADSRFVRVCQTIGRPG
jgi:eukaryotic-like serine/threonine-protein kinase